MSDSKTTPKPQGETERDALSSPPPIKPEVVNALQRDGQTWKIYVNGYCVHHTRSESVALQTKSIIEDALGVSILPRKAVSRA